MYLFLILANIQIYILKNILFTKQGIKVKYEHKWNYEQKE